MMTPEQIASRLRLSPADVRLNVTSRLIAVVSNYGGERIVAGPAMDRLAHDLADEAEALAREGFLRCPAVFAQESGP